MRQRLLVIKHRAVIEDVEITTAQFAFEKVLSFIDGLSRISDCARKFLPFTPKWIGRYDWRIVKVLPRSWLFNAITRNKRPSVIFTNQHRSRCRRAAGGSGFGYMRNGQKKKDHECCAAHFSFIARILLLGHSEEREGAGRALLIWSCAAGGDCRSFILQIERISLAVDHLAALRDRHVDAGAALSIGQLDSLGHCIGILATVLHGLESQLVSGPRRLFCGILDLGCGGLLGF